MMRDYAYAWMLIISYDHSSLGQETSIDNRTIRDSTTKPLCDLDIAYSNRPDNVHHIPLFWWG